MGTLDAFAGHGWPNFEILAACRAGETDCGGDRLFGDGLEWHEVMPYPVDASGVYEALDAAQ
jgi:hypothetical protein